MRAADEQRSGCARKRREKDKLQMRSSRLRIAKAGSVAGAGVGVILAALCVGCGPAAEMVEAPEIEEAGPVAFESGAGLKLAPETREALDLEMAQVGSGRFTDRYQAPARNMGGRGAEVCLRAVVPAEKAPKQGVEAAIHDAAGTKTWSGRVDEVNRHLVKVSGDVEVLVCLSGKHDSAPAGGGLEISYALSEERESLSVPPSALVRAALGDFVFVSNEGFLLRRRVEVGQVDEDRVEIRSGLQLGDSVVSKAADKLWILELAMVGGMSNLETAEVAQ